MDKEGKQGTVRGVFLRPTRPRLDTNGCSNIGMRLACKATDEQQMSRRCGSAGFVAPEAGRRGGVFRGLDQKAF